MPLALGPVAHDLHAGLAVDHHGGGEVPVAAGEVRVDHAADRAQLVERLDHGVAAQGLLVELDEGLLVEFGPAGADHGAVEDRGVLPGLAAMRHRGHAGVLELLGQLDEVLPGRGLGAADLVEQRLVHPDPVGRVHVEGCRDIVAVILVDGLQRRRDHLVPAVLLGQRRQVAQSTLLGPVLDHEAQHLHGGRRVAGGHAGLQHGAGLVAAAAGDGGVLPGDALLLEVARAAPASAAASPPEVHQWMISTSSAARAWAAPSARPIAAAPARRKCLVDMLFVLPIASRRLVSLSRLLPRPADAA